MTVPASPIQAHYDSLLARHYLWMAGGMEANIRAGQKFLEDHALVPHGNGTALDLGAGCGFIAIPLAGAGFDVTAVDISGEMLGILQSQPTGKAIMCIRADIRETASWSGIEPELIVCTGDTLTHLPDIRAVQELIEACGRELTPKNRLVISCRNYAHQPAGTSAVIPVRRQEDRIFICRLDFYEKTVRVNDLIYARSEGRWRRASGTYPKLRIRSEDLEHILASSGFTADSKEISDDWITIVARRNP